MNENLIALAGSLVLAGAHAFMPALERVSRRHSVSLASFGGGAGLAYVFLYLLFELAKDGARKIHAVLPVGPEPLETLLILLLAAVTAIYLLQMRLLKSPTGEYRGFAGFFLTYNLLAGAGLVEEARWGAFNLAVYALALGLHLAFNERLLLDLCPGTHGWRWRGALAGAPVFGCALAAALPLPEALLYGALTVIAGGTIINVIHRELPDPVRLRPAAFLAGVVGYAALIMATWRY
jgi:hypothetical protein